MTNQEINTILDRHLDDWFSDPDGPTLRDRMADAIREAIKERDKLWAGGKAALEHELQQARQCRDDAVAAAHLMHHEK